MVSDIEHPLDKLSVYADYSSLEDEECLTLIKAEIGNYNPEDDYKIIAAEKLKGLRKLRLGSYAIHVVNDPGGRFTIQAWFNSRPYKSGLGSPPTSPRTDHMAPRDAGIIERIHEKSLTPTFKSAFHPDFD